MSNLGDNTNYGREFFYKIMQSYQEKQSSIKILNKQFGILTIKKLQLEPYHKEQYP